MWNGQSSRSRTCSMFVMHLWMQPCYFPRSPSQQWCFGGYLGLTWSADQTSKKALADLPFQEYLLFGATLDNIIKNLMGSKSTFLPQAKNLLFWTRAPSPSRPLWVVPSILDPTKTHGQVPLSLKVCPHLSRGLSFSSGSQALGPPLILTSGSMN